MSQRESAKSQRRADIMESARVLLRDNPSTSFSVRALADKAGVSSATLYNLFGSKQDILVAVLNDDLDVHREALSNTETDGIAVLFQAVKVTREFLDREPEFYRSIVAEVCLDGGTRLRQLFGGPRYLLWKNMLSAACESGLIRADLDPDALTITVTQTIAANVQEWAIGQLSLDEMELRISYALALILLGIATDKTRETLEKRLRLLESDLQQLWRDTLRAHLQKGELDAEMQVLLADQLKHID